MLDVLTRAGCFVAIIFLGFFLKKVGVFHKDNFPVLSKVAIKITLPAAIVTSFAGMTIDPAMLGIAGLGLGCGLLYMLIAFLLHLRKPANERAFFVLNVPGYNIGCFTMPFAQSFLGPLGVIVVSLFDVGNAFVCLGGAYGAASIIKDGGGFSAKRLFKTLLTSVPFVCYIIMVTLNLCKVTLPGPVVSFAQTIANANAFVAMFMLGVGFELSSDRKQLGAILKVVIIRYAVAAVLACLFYFLLPVAPEIRKALVILVFSPIGAAVPAFTQELKEDVGLSSAINSVCIIISIVVIVALLTVM